MKTLKNIWNWILFIFVHDGEIAKEAEELGLSNYRGQE